MRAAAADLISYYFLLARLMQGSHRAENCADAGRRGAAHLRPGVHALRPAPVCGPGRCWARLAGRRHACAHHICHWGSQLSRGQRFGCARLPQTCLPPGKSTEQGSGCLLRPPVKTVASSGGWCAWRNCARSCPATNTSRQHCRQWKNCTACCLHHLHARVNNVGMSPLVADEFLALWRGRCTGTRAAWPAPALFWEPGRLSHSPEQTG